MMNSARWHILSAELAVNATSDKRLDILSSCLRSCILAGVAHLAAQNTVHNRVLKPPKKISVRIHLLLDLKVILPSANGTLIRVSIPSRDATSATLASMRRLATSSAEKSRIVKMGNVF
jgi:hypothetical protein